MSYDAYVTMISAQSTLLTVIQINTVVELTSYSVNRDAGARWTTPATTIRDAFYIDIFVTPHSAESAKSRLL